jgi:hypothetical protein
MQLRRLEHGHHDWVENSNPGRKFQGVQSNPMTSKFLRFVLAIAFSLSIAAMAQTGTAAATPPLQPPHQPLPSRTCDWNASWHHQHRAGHCGYERRSPRLRCFEQKLEPKQTELKSTSDEIEGLKKNNSRSRR